MIPCVEALFSDGGHSLTEVNLFWASAQSFKECLRWVVLVFRQATQNEVLLSA